MTRIRVGCCGFAGGMRSYFNRFRLVEIQHTFYRIPKLETARRWRQLAPAEFEFTLKAWQLITHLPVSPTYRKGHIKIVPGTENNYGFFRPSDEVRQAWQATENIARALEARVIVFQCPPGFHETDENVNNMKSFFAPLKHSGFTFAWEPRGQWKEATIKTLCSDLGIVHCVDPMEKESLCGRPQYFRLHGGPRYQHRFTEEELGGLLDRIGNEEAYVLFNNLNMLQDALTFERPVRERAA